MAGARCPPPDRPLSVLVVDDEPDVLTYLAAVLEQRGHHAHVALNAAEGFALIKQERPDVACIDIVMPEETGIALYRRIRSDPEIGDTPVIFITALRPEMTAVAPAVGEETMPEPDGYIEKPPDAKTFLETVVEVARKMGRR
jgi:CheY-like chemotaxis protein